MTDYLETYEWIVDSASDFDSARRRLDANHYAVVIADLRLSPKEAIAGLDVLAHVRTTSPETKTILLTAYGSPHVEEEARRLGVDRVSPETEATRRASAHGLSGARRRAAP